MKNRLIINSPFRQSALITLCLCALFFTSAQAHTYHTSLTRMDYNEKEKLVEVTIQLFTHDLKPILERRLKSQVDLEKTPVVDAEILKYLNDNFIFQNKSGESQKLKWVGKEFETDVIYVYLEIPFAEDLANAKLKNTIFFESFAEQTNLVVTKFGDKKSDLLFKAGDKFKEL
jgi:hypothetical protein